MLVQQRCLTAPGSARSSIGHAMLRAKLPAASVVEGVACAPVVSDHLKRRQRRRAVSPVSLRAAR